MKRMATAITKQAQILRAAQKDENITDIIFNNFSDILYELLDRKIWFQSQNLIKFLSQLTYFSLTTLSNLQTLGEEYTGIIQIHPKKKILSKQVRLLSLLLQFGGEPALIKILSILRNYLKSNTHFVKGAREDLINLTYHIQRLLPFVYRLNKSIFFLFGIYYHLGKRITSIQYGIVKPWLSETVSLNGFKILGILSLLYLLILTFNNSIIRCEQIYSELKFKHHKISTKEDLQFKCALCLEATQNTSVTCCGHIFCWSCISNWIQSKTQCPICREQVESFNFTLLKN